MHIISELYYKFYHLFHDPMFAAQFINNRFYFVIMVVLLMRFKYATYSSMWMSALINIPGTLLHELMHYLVGLFLNARPCDFTLFPQRNLEGNYVMGSVGFKNVTYYNAIPASMAPLLLLPIGFYLNRHILPMINPTFINYAAYVLLQTIIVENSIPSRADFKVAGMYFQGVLIYGTLFIALLLMI